VTSGCLRNVNEVFALLGCYAPLIVVTDFSGLPVGLIKLSRNVGISQSTERNIPEAVRRDVVSIW